MADEACLREAFGIDAHSPLGEDALDGLERYRLRLKPESLATVRRDWTRFATTVLAGMELSEVDDHDLIGFVLGDHRDSRSGRPWQAGRRHVAMANIRKMLRVLGHPLPDTEPLRDLHTLLLRARLEEVVHVPGISDQRSVHAITISDLFPQPAMDFRDLYEEALVRLVADTGGRPDETLALRASDLRQTMGVWVVYFAVTKGLKGRESSRTRQLSPVTMKTLRAYFDAIGRPHPDAPGYAAKVAGRYLIEGINAQHRPVATATWGNHKGKPARTERHHVGTVVRRRAIERAQTLGLGADVIATTVARLTGRSTRKGAGQARTFAGMNAETKAAAGGWRSSADITYDKGQDPVSGAMWRYLTSRW